MPSPVVSWVPEPADLHLVSRFSHGLDDDLVDQVRAVGGRAWFERQLRPREVDDGRAGAMLAWFPDLSRTPAELWQRYQNGVVSVQGFADDLARWTILRRAYSRRQLHETMVDFWSTLLHVPCPNVKAWPQRFRYDQAIRKNALGRFTDLLEATVLHPAMLCFLDNWESAAGALNENLGRELLELYTVGIGAGYDEHDVRDSARILTGWRADQRGSWKRRYVPAAHATGPVRVLGFTAANADPDGRQMSVDYLHWLARHPATARRLAHRLAVRFVADDPPAGLVTAVAEAYLAADTDIRSTLRALVDHPGFAAAEHRGVKVRTPVEDYAATLRALGVRALDPSGHPDDLAELCLWQAVTAGQRPFDWPRPDGAPDSGPVWSTATRMLGSWAAHQALAFGQRPTHAVAYREPQSWLPALPVPFTDLVDHVSRRLLRRPATPQLVTACGHATDTHVGDVVGPTHPIVRYVRIPHLLTALLDSTEHMSR